MNKEEYKKVAIYPYSDNFYAFVKHFNKYNTFLQVTELVSPTGWGINGKDAGVAYNKPEIGLKISDDIHQAIENCDILMVAECECNETFRKIIINDIITAIERRKEIICTMMLHEDELDIFHLKSKSLEVSFHYSPGEVHWLALKDILYIKPKRLYFPKAPVIFVGELMDGLEGFDGVLAVTDYLKSQGYKTITIGAREYCEILGILSLPSFITQTTVSDNEKIIYFNNYIKYLDENEKPDLFVIQLPGAMMKYNDQFTNGFGVTPYLMSQAVQGDYFILSVQYDNIDTKFYNMLSETFTYRFGFGIDCIFMSNKMFDRQNSIQAGKNTFLHLQQEMLDNAISNYYYEAETPIYNIDNLKDYNIMFDQLIEVLTSGNTCSNVV